MHLSHEIGARNGSPCLLSSDLPTGQDPRSPECPSRDIETLSSSSSVAMVKATNLRQGDNVAEFWWLHRPWFGRFLRQRKVSSRPVVIAKAPLPGRPGVRRGLLLAARAALGMGLVRVDGARQ
jgi:hypothetical protein